MSLEEMLMLIGHKEVEIYNLRKQIDNLSNIIQAQRETYELDNREQQTNNGIRPRGDGNSSVVDIREAFRAIQNSNQGISPAKAETEKI